MFSWNGFPAKSVFVHLDISFLIQSRLQCSRRRNSEELQRLHRDRPRLAGTCFRPKTRLLVHVGRGKDERLPLPERISSALQQFKANGSVRLSVGENSTSHNNVSALVDLVNDYVFNVWGFHGGHIA